MLRLDVDGREAGEALLVEPEEVDPHFPASVGVAAVDGDIVPVLAVEDATQPGEPVGALLLAVIHPRPDLPQRVERRVEVPATHEAGDLRESLLALSRHPPPILSPAALPPT